MSGGFSAWQALPTLCQEFRGHGRSTDFPAHKDREVVVTGTPRACLREAEERSRGIHPTRASRHVTALHLTPRRQRKRAGRQPVATRPPRTPPTAIIAFSVDWKRKWHPYDNPCGL